MVFLLRALAAAAVLLLALPLGAQDLWTFRHKKPLFSVGVPRGWEEVVPSQSERRRKHFAARIEDPLTRSDPVPRRVELFVAPSPARKTRRKLTDQEIRIAPHEFGAGETFDLVQQEKTTIAGFAALLVVGEVRKRGGPGWTRVEVTYQGARNLYAVVYTVPEGEFDWLEARIRKSLDSFWAKDVPRNPYAAWAFGMGGLVLLVLALVGLHRWVRS